MSLVGFGRAVVAVGGGRVVGGGLGAGPTFGATLAAALGALELWRIAEEP